MTKLEQRLARLCERLDIVGHRAYSRDNLSTAAAVKDFETIEKLKVKIAELKYKISCTPFHRKNIQVREG
jgi:hypothetical protein